MTRGKSGKPERHESLDGEPTTPPPEAGDPAERPSAVSTVPPPPNPESERTTALETERDRIKDQLLRVAADFDNFRKRTRKDVDEARRSGLEDALRAFLPILDNLGRAVEHAANAKDASAIADGVRMVLRQAEEALGRLGVTSFSPVGEAFDPALHEAIQQISKPDAAPGTIVGVMQPGYRWADRLLRPASVIVAAASATRPAPPPIGAETSGAPGAGKNDGGAT